MATLSGPAWDDPQLNALALRLREAHTRVADLPGALKPRLTRQLLLITDLAKRDPALAVKRLESFMIELDGDENVP
ncbi:hypothetical protein NE236_40895 [Actinoallomurus purpureus]|uniref:hypothetical protein n=1 Tax=Actinoallomurus purpureus TaxID=478114 RepID=UPI0020927A3F|nr:hypothetical protein [Actinoallomurus purpureus]MCO6011327.1 hypothetical protein [Actinoallomurus purpureus]